MSPQICPKCTSAVSEDFVMCDACNMLIHQGCAGLSVTELRAITLKGGRALMFFCQECIATFKQMPKLMKNLNHILEINKELQEENTLLKQKLEHLTCQINDIANKEEVISEVMERQNRASNIIVFNVKESHKDTHVQRMNEDKEAILSIIEEFEIDKSNIKLFRLGKPVAGKCRPIKVVLKAKEDAKFILKNKGVIKIPSVKVSGDQTVAQRDYFRKVKSELQKLIDEGDNSKTIKFINDSPTIVSKSIRDKKN